jgi:hypothetical protein
MTKKDYVLIADILAFANDSVASGQLSSADIVPFIAKRFAVTAEGDNPRFDRARFFNACGVQS